MGQSDRRVFLSCLLGASAGGLTVGAVYAVCRYLVPTESEETLETVKACATDDQDLRLRGFKIVRVGADPVILIRLKNGDLRAFSARCTHLDCIVEYRPGPPSQIVCHCHGGTYDLTGGNVGGPPPRPLRPYRVRVVASDGGGAGVVVVSKT
jgi:Rieske Fe-S protein